MSFGCRSYYLQENFNSQLLLILVALMLSVSGFPAFPQAPNAIDDEVEMMEDSVERISVLENDGDVGPLAKREITIVEEPEYGEVTVIDHSEIEYTPDDDFSGGDSFVYRVTITGEGSSEAEVSIDVLPENDPPFPIRNTYTTTVETPVTITLVATDEDIDPLRPDRHPIEFHILGETLHGEITGDIRDVQYEEPNRAFVDLEYTPDTDFRGVETINYRVEDERGVVNISTVVIDIEPETEAPSSLSGYWEPFTTFSSDEPEMLSDFDMDLTTIYRYSDVEFRTDSTWSEENMDSLKLKTKIPFSVFDIDSTIDFDPTDEEPFNYWRARTEFQFSEIDFRHTFYLDEDSEDTYQRFEGRWRLSDISFRSRTQFTGADPQFEESSLRTRWNWSDCGLTVNTEMVFSDEGFAEFAIDVGDIPLIFDTYFEFETTFTPTSKEVEPNLFYRSKWIDCFKILAELKTRELENKIQGVNIYGIRFRYTFENGLSLRIDNSFNDDKNSFVTGDPEFRNKFSLSGPFYAGYRAPGRIKMTHYLGSIESQELFGWGKSRLRVIAPLSDQLDINTDLVLSSDSPTVELTLGAEIVW